VAGSPAAKKPAAAKKATPAKPQADPVAPEPVAPEPAADQDRHVPEDVRIQSEMLAAPLSAPETRPGVRTELREQPEPQTQLDDVAGSAAVQTLAGEDHVRLLFDDGKPIKSADLDDLFVDYQDGTLVQVTRRVEEEYTTRNATTKSRRLLFPAGEYIPRARAAAFRKAVADN
jgi:hypothetical protein